MRVGFDVAALSHPHSRGLERVVRNVVHTLERRARIEVVRLEPGPGENLRRWRQDTLRRRVRDTGVLGVHSFTSAFSLRGAGRRVQTVHEIPWRHAVRENAGLRHRLWAALGGLRADRIVCPSEHVARDLARVGFRTRGKVRVVPWGVTGEYRPDPPPSVVDEAVLMRYRLGAEPFLLCPGAVRAKKNLAALLRGLAERKLRALAPLRILVTGGDTPALRSALGLASKLGLARWIAMLDEVDEADMPSLYRQARAVVVLSHSEGFALPVLEGMACGTPVVVPPASAQAELAGEAGILVEPSSPASVAEGLQRALDERRARRAAGLQRAADFTWEHSARRIEELWQELA